MGSDNAGLMTREMLKQLAAAFVKGMPEDIPYEVAQAWIKDQRVIDLALRMLLIPPPRTVITDAADFGDKLREQKAFWRRLFPTLDFDFDPHIMVVWPRRQGHNRLLVTPPGEWVQRLFEKCKQRFPCEHYLSLLDEIVHLNGSPSMATARWFSDAEESDLGTKVTSTSAAEQRFLAGITLPERLAYELVYFEETGRNLDKASGTLVSGSRLTLNERDSINQFPRHPYEFVPFTFWIEGKFAISWFHRFSNPGKLRIRAAF